MAGVPRRIKKTDVNCVMKKKNYIQHCQGFFFFIIRKWHQTLNKGHETTSILEYLQWLLWGNVLTEWLFCGYNVKCLWYLRFYKKDSDEVLTQSENDTKMFVDRALGEKASSDIFHLQSIVRRALAAHKFPATYGNREHSVWGLSASLVPMDLQKLSD